jgi:hypothetical protein
LDEAKHVTSGHSGAADWQYALRHSRTNRLGPKSSIVRYCPKADKHRFAWNVGFAPEAGTLCRFRPEADILNYKKKAPGHCPELFRSLMT